MNGRSTYLRCLAALALTAFLPETFGESVKLYADLKKEDDGWHFVEISQDERGINLLNPYAIRNEQAEGFCGRILFGTVELDCVKDKRLADFSSSHITFGDIALTPAIWAAALIAPVFALTMEKPWVGLVAPLTVPMGLVSATGEFDQEAYVEAVKEAEQKAASHLSVADALEALTWLNDSKQVEYPVVDSHYENLSLKLNELNSRVISSLQQSVERNMRVDIKNTHFVKSLTEPSIAATARKTTRVYITTSLPQPFCAPPTPSPAPYVMPKMDKLDNNSWESFAKILLKRKQEKEAEIKEYKTQVEAVNTLRQAENQRCELALENYQHALESSSKQATLVWPNRIPEWIDTPYTLSASPESWTIDGMQSTVKPTLTVTFQAPDS